MLRPEYLASLPEPMVELFSQLEADILADIVRRIVKADYTLTDTAAWQAEKLSAILGSRDEVERRIAETLQRSDAEVRDIMREAYEESEKAEAAVYGRAGITITRTPELTDTLAHWIGNENRVIRNLTGTVAYRSEDVLVDALDRAHLQVLSGAFDYNTAIRKAVNELSAKGIMAFEIKGSKENSVGRAIYRDSFGPFEKGVRRENLEVAVRRSVMTGVNRAAAEVSLARCDEFGTKLVEVSAHVGARPTHAVWQGEIYSRDGKTGGYPDFVSSTGYGTGEGLCGWNCRHSFSPYFEGAPRAFSDVDRAESDAVYEAQQEQRRHERAVRAAKREAEGTRAALDEEKAKESPDAARMKMLEEDYRKASVKLSAKREALRGYIASAPSSYGLRNDSARTAVGGFGRSEAAKASWAVRKVLTEEAERAKIEAAQKLSGVKGMISLHPKPIELSSFSFDSNHINKERTHNVSRREAESFMKNAAFSIERWNGKFLLFVSSDGAVYLDTEDKNIRTAYKADEYDDKLKTLYKELSDE